MQVWFLKVHESLVINRIEQQLSGTKFPDKMDNVGPTGQPCGKAKWDTNSYWMNLVYVIFSVIKNYYKMDNLH